MADKKKVYQKNVNVRNSTYQDDIKTFFKTGAAVLTSGLGLMAIGLGTDAVKDKMKKAKHQKMLKKYPGARIDKKTKVQKIGP
tara:strand:- start:514 stop:762 length:249 start_codon:yes stop_codon:yes gene_type:complete